MANEFTMHSEPIDLPSKGWFYNSTNPLSSGKIDLYYMTAKHEDILTSRNLISKGVVIDKLLESLIATPGISLNDILLCDKDAIMIAARILGYGAEYSINMKCPACNSVHENNIDLQTIDERECPNFIPEYKGKNEFLFTLPFSKKTIMYKYMTHGDENTVQLELQGLKKALRTDVSRDITSRLRRIILAVEGNTDGEMIRNFVDNMPSRDTFAFREHVRSTTPGIDLTTVLQCSSCGYEGRVEIPIDHTFFWPNTRI